MVFTAAPLNFMPSSLTCPVAGAHHLRKHEISRVVRATDTVNGHLLMPNADSDESAEREHNTLRPDLSVHGEGVPVFSEIAVCACADRLSAQASTSAAFAWQSCVMPSGAAVSSARASSVIFKSAVSVVNSPFVSASGFNILCVELCCAANERA